MKKIDVSLPQNAYPIFLGSGLIKDLPALIADTLQSQNILLVSGEHVSALYRKPVENILRDAGYTVWFFELRSGEAHKNLDSIRMGYDRALEYPIDRKTMVIALGGGVIGDMAGFIAATLFRGMDFIQIPTTLLAQVDSSVGGKVGVNIPQGKNLIGHFYQPKTVLIDPDFLKTLAIRERISGFSEMLKYGFIANKVLAELLENEYDSVIHLKNLPDLEKIIHQSITIKRDIVLRDEKESRLRMILNFGHTIGHAIEATTGYGTFTHGEAVLVGMAGSLLLSIRKGLLNESEIQPHIEFLRRIPLGADLSMIDSESIVSTIQKDKKMQAGRIQFILLDRIGHAVIRDDVTSEDILNTVEKLKELSFAQTP